MLQIGDLVRVRTYDEIPEHPIYTRTAESIRERQYFGLPGTTLEKLSGLGFMTIEEILPSEKVFTWYGATIESADKLTEAEESVYTLSAALTEFPGGRVFHYQFLENMLEPAETAVLETPDAEEFFASLF